MTDNTDNRDDRDPGFMTPEELARLEAETDPLIALVSYVARQRADSGAYDDPRFLAWYAKDLRERHEVGADEEALSPPEVAALAQRIALQLQADRFRIECIDHGPAGRPHEASAPTSQMVERLSGSREAPFADLAVAAGAGRGLWDIECDTTVELPPHLDEGRYLALRVSGDSMIPLMHSGDTVLVKLGADIRPDSVVVARMMDHEYVVKRVGRVTPGHLELLSLNPAFPPARVPRAENAVLGTVVLRWCAHNA